MNKRTFPAIFVLLIALIVTGCGGSALTPAPAPKPKTTKVSGTIYVPEGMIDVAHSPERFLLLSWIGGTAQAAEMKGTTGLAGAKVVAQQLPDRKTIAGPVETDAQGQYTLTGLPVDTPIIITAVKDDLPGGKKVRVSTFIERVSESTSADANPATSLAAEALLASADTDRFTAATWNAVLEKAQEMVDSLDPEAYETLLVVGEGAFKGDPGQGLKEEFAPITEIAEKGPEVDEPVDPDADLKAAKAMVDSLRNAGHQLSGTVQAQLDAHRESIENDVAPFLVDFGDELMRFSARSRDLALISEHGAPGNYQEIHTEDEWWDLCWTSDWDWEHEPDPCFEPEKEFQGRFEGPYPMGTSGYALQDKENNVYALQFTGGNGQYIFTGKGPSVDYNLSVSHDGDIENFELENAWIDGHIKNKSNVDVTLKGTLTAEGYREFDNGLNLPTKITFGGRLESTNPRIVTESELTFGYEAGSSIEDIHMAYIESNGALKFPTFHTYSNFHLELVPLHRSFEDDYGVYEWVEPVPRALTLNGSFSDWGEGEEQTRFDGSFSFEIDTDDLEAAVEQGYADTTIHFSGEVRAPDYPEMTLDTTIHWVEKNKVESSVVYEGRDRLEGTVDITVDPLDVRLNLTNRDKLVTFLHYGTSGSVTGSISKNGVELAEIKDSDVGIVVVFTDGETKTLN